MEILLQQCKYLFYIARLAVVKSKKKFFSPDFLENSLKDFPQCEQCVDCSAHSSKSREREENFQMNLLWIRMQYKSTLYFTDCQWKPFMIKQLYSSYKYHIISYPHRNLCCEDLIILHISIFHTYWVYNIWIDIRLSSTILLCPNFNCVTTLTKNNTKHCLLDLKLRSTSFNVISVSVHL